MSTSFCVFLFIFYRSRNNPSCRLSNSGCFVIVNSSPSIKKQKILSVKSRRSELWRKILHVYTPNSLKAIVAIAHPHTNWHCFTLWIYFRFHHNRGYLSSTGALGSQIVSNLLALVFWDVICFQAVVN